MTPTRTVTLAFALVALITVGLVAANPGKNQYDFETRGRIASFNARARTFIVNAYTVKTNASTRFAYEGSSITSSRFWNTNRNGSWVEVKGNLAKQTITAVNLELEGNAEYQGHDEIR